MTLCFSDIVHVYNKACFFLLEIAMDLIPILLGSFPLAHNAQHSLVGASVSEPPLVDPTDALSR